MAKQSGMGDRLLVGGYDISGDIGSLGRIGGGPAVLDVTDITQSANSRVGGELSGGIDFTSYFDKATGAAHPTLRGLPTTDVNVTYLRGTTLGNPGACMVSKQTNYDGTRNQDGSFTLAVSAQSGAGYPLEWGRQLTAGTRTDGAATNGTGVDFTASTAFGLQAYLHVFSVTGTSVTVKIQESSDNGVGDAWADVVGGAFTAVLGAAVSAQRIATTTGLTVERYLRAVTTGTFSDAQFVVVVTKNTTLVAY